MKPTEILMNEHRVIEQVLDCLEKIADECETTGTFEEGNVEDVVYFLKNFADLRHHKKEEDRLFPLAEARGVPRRGGPIGVMIFDHIQGRAYVEDIAQSVRKASAGEMEDRQTFIDSSRAYVKLLREHIQKEDECLFPMADRAMNEEDQNGLMKSFEAAHTEEIDPEVQRKCLAIAANLAEKFEVRKAVVDLKW